METWIRRACRQRAYRQLTVWFVVGACLVAGNVAMSDYWVSFFQGPFAVSDSNATVLNAFDEKRDFVTVTGSQVVDSGVREYTTETRNGVKGSPYVSSTYSIMIVGDHAGLVVKGNAPLTATGQLKPLPSNLPALIFPDEKDADIRSHLYPVLLDTDENYRIGGYVMMGVLLLYAFLVWVFARKAWAHVRNISTHPVVKRIESWSDAAEVTALAEREMVTPRFGKHGILVTDTFVINKSFFSFNLLAWNHLLWAYRKQTTTRYYGVIPIGRSQEAILHFYGGSVSIGGSKKKVEELLLFAAAQAPWAVLGYSDELNRLWTKKMNDFTTAVEARRAEYFTPTSLPPSA